MLMKLDMPEISPLEARKAMELAKAIFAKYNVSAQDQDLLYHSILTMGMAAMVTTRTNELLRQLGIKSESVVDNSPVR
jgi:hypothetical protein